MDDRWRDPAEERHNADLLATGDGEANVSRLGDNAILIGNALDDNGNVVIVERVRGILHVAVGGPGKPKTWADIDLDDLRTALQMLGVDC